MTDRQAATGASLVLTFTAQAVILEGYIRS